MQPVRNNNIITAFLLQLILVNTLNCLYDSISNMLRKNVEKRTLIENMDGVFLTVDEICDNGFVEFLFKHVYGELDYSKSVWIGKLFMKN